MNRIIILFLLCFSGQWLVGQSQTDRELNRLAKSILEQLTPETVGDIIVDNFTDIDGRESRIGVHLTKKFITALQRNAKGDYSILNRSKLDRLYKENDLDEGTLDYGEGVDIGKRKTADATITATLFPSENMISLDLFCVDIASQVQLAAGSGQLLITPSMKVLIDSEDNHSIVSEGENQDAEIASGKHVSRNATGISTTNVGNLQVQCSGCTILDHDIICDLIITSKDRETDLSLYTSGTRLVTQNKSIRASSVALGENSNSLRVSQIIPPNQSVSAQIKFKGGGATIDSRSSMTLQCHSSSMRTFQININL